MPLSKDPKLVQFAHFLTEDNKALNKVKMDWTVATYIFYHHHKALITWIKEHFLV